MCIEIIHLITKRKIIMNNENLNKSIKYDGHCAFAVSTGKTDVKGGNSSLTIDNNNYVFSNSVAKILFKLLPGRIKKADEIWNKK
jgi:hypothetical protein